MEEYQDYDNYLAFLESVLLLRDADSGFLLFDDSFSDKILHVIQIFRFEQPSPEVRAAINEIIDSINHMKGYSDSYRNLLKNGYLSFQEDARKVQFSDDESFLYSLAYDALVYMALKSGDMKSVPEEDMVLASINYMIEMVPEFLKQPEVSETVLSYLTVLEEINGWPLSHGIKKYSSKTKEAFQKIKTKEE